MVVIIFRLLNVIGLWNFVLCVILDGLVVYDEWIKFWYFIIIL